MHIVCSYSSLSFQCEHFPGSLESREYSHPIFHAPQRKLLGYLRKWAARELTPTDSYLLYLSLLRSSNLVDFRTPAIRSEKTDAIVAQEMEHLAIIITRLNTVPNPSTFFPHYVISPETRDLTNTQYWIQNWNDSYEDFRSGKAKEIDDRNDWKKLQSRENALARLIKNPHRPIASYSAQIAQWAAIAGAFPETGTVPSPFTGLQTSISDYWCSLIEYCAHEVKLYSIPRTDLLELLEHCEENIPIGSIYSNALFKVLRNALERQKNYLGMGDLDISRSTYEILSEDDTVESANMRAAVQAAPLSMPSRDQYPSKFEYLKAKMRYDMAMKAKKADE